MFAVHLETQPSHLFPALLDSSTRSCLVVFPLKEKEADVENNKVKSQMASMKEHERVRKAKPLCDCNNNYTIDIPHI